ncbi:MAG: tyrosine--tRNA ligase [Planctomycetota bacterium]|jgi:tyrosyl-tRNA synthetase|nr:tyrosine--tRNA ligase [Acidimicrobiales bacterium]MDA0254272.1 tyrosine--tRNA ligase [Planctomycetota bacterium]MDA1202515.1 tyrosine--tRNA ligase [Planctomycetota bacterium]
MSVAPDLLAEFEARGLVHQSTDPAALREWLATPGRRVYAGFDPTADSLHVGHLVALMLLRRVAAAGHEPVAVIGGATGMVGDPSGRSEERNLLSPEELAANIAGVDRQIRTILAAAGPAGPLAGRVHVVDNADWMRDVGYLTFLRDVGKHVPLAQMLGKDSVKSRLERDGGLSYTEFSYMLLQAWDFVHLADALDCRVQIGGSDQWGNITAGIELGRRLRGCDLHGITCPLLTKADGTKMGKTAAGAIWLDPARTSPYRFYQYWINLNDDDAGRCLLRLTELPLEEIRSLDEARAATPAARETQKRLAAELTRLVHGEEGLAVARQATDIFFGAEITAIDDAALTEIFADVPSSEFPRSALDGDGLALVEALEATGLAKSKGAARRTIEQGGGYVNNRRVADVAYRLTPRDLAGAATLVLRSGKKSYALARFR